jgi:hypothetical protein
MTNELSRNGKSEQFAAVRKAKMTSGGLLAAVAILTASLGVTATQSAVEVTAAGGTKLAETKAIHIENKQVKTNPPVSKGVTFNPTPVKSKRKN